jgi:hypothetical protein
MHRIENNTYATILGKRKGSKWRALFMDSKPDSEDSTNQANDSNWDAEQPAPQTKPEETAAEAPSQEQTEAVKEELQPVHVDAIVGLENEDSVNQPNTQAAVFNPVVVTPVADQSSATTGGPVLASVSSKPGASTSFTSNPFLCTVKGLTTNLQENPGVSLLSAFIASIVTIIIYALSFLVLINNDSAVGYFITTILVGIWFVTSVAVFYSISASSIKYEHIPLKQHYGRALKKFFPLLGLTIMSTVLTGIGVILLIVPGVIFGARAALAPIIMFSEGLGPVASLKRSLKLTKGHTNEMLGAIFAGLFIGESYYSLLFGAVSVSPFVGRYNDLIELEKTNAPKSKTHPLNFLYLLGPVIIAIIAIVIATHAHSSVNNSNVFVNTNSNTFQNNNSTGSQSFTEN